MNGDGVDAADLAIVLDEFGLGEVRTATFLAEGLMNRNWRLDTSLGSFALKLLMDVPVDRARRNAEVVARLATACLPVCAPTRTRAGDVVTQIQERSYLVSPWAPGSHHPGTHLPLQVTRSFGKLVAEFHQALLAQTGLSLPSAETPPQFLATKPDVAVDRARHLIAVIDSTDHPTPFDHHAKAFLARRITLISQHEHDVPDVGRGNGPFGWTHGDLQHRNILYADDVVQAVLDWDRLAVRPLADEVARTAQVQFGSEDGRFDLERVAAFVAGYRSIIPLSQDDLARAVNRLWWKRMSDYWMFEFHYLRGDHGPDSLMAPTEALLHWWTRRRDEVQEAFAPGT